MEPTILEGGLAQKIRSASHGLLAVALLLLPITIVPVSWFPFLLLKVAVFCVLISIATILFFVQASLRGAFALPRSVLVLALVALPVAYGISSFFSQNQALSYVADGVEPNTLFFAGLCAASALLFCVMLDTKRSVHTSLYAVTLGLLIAGCFQIFVFMFGPGVFGLAVFQTLSSNLVGSWNDFGLLIGSLAVFALIGIDIVKPRIFYRVLLAAVLVLACGVLSLVNLDMLWYVLGACALLIGVAGVVGGRTTDPMLPQRRVVPYASFVVLIVSAISIAWGAQVNATLVRIVPVSELQARPSVATTYAILKSTYAQSTRTALVGTGPGTFVEQWLTYKPSDVNTTQFWNLDFFGGFGTIPTAFITTGILGGLAWVCIMLALLWMFIRRLFRPYVEPALQTAAIASSVGALYIFLTAAVYLPGEIPLLFGFILAGIALSCERFEASRTQLFSLQGVSLPRRVVGALLALIFLVVPLTLTYFVLNRTVATAYLSRGFERASTNTTLATLDIERALRIHRNDTALRLLANIKLSEAQAIAKEEAKPDQAARFQAAFGDSLKYAQDAVVQNPRNYQNYMLLAQLFEALIPLNVSGAFDNAKQQYFQAIKYNPYNPGLFLSLARTEAEGGTEDGFRKAIQATFAAKPNFTEAALLVTQVEIARKNIDGAIIAAQVAVQTAPRNPGTLFQLGLLQYAKGNNDAARQALEAALALQPDYANAKYFLGLTYYNLGKKQDAGALFQDLRKSNPDNQEVAFILSNLEAGRDPFASSTPPITPSPEKRSTPPIKE